MEILFDLRRRASEESAHHLLIEYDEFFE